MAREQSNFPGLKDPRRQSALGRMADREVLRAQKAAAWQAMTDPQPQPEMTKTPSAKEFALNSRVAEANREEKPTGALALILRELSRFFKADDELADAMGDFSLRQGATATGGAILGLAAPAYLPLRTALARAATGVPLSVAGGWVMDPASEKIFGSSVSDPLSDAVFGAMAGASGKIVTPMLSAIATSSGDAEAALGKVLRYAASKSDGNLARPFKVHKTPFAAEAEFNLPGATRIRRTPEPLTESEGKAYEGMSVVPLLMDSGAERSVLRGDAINRITGERFAKGGLARIVARMGKDAAPARKGVANVIKEKGGNWLTGSVEDALGGLKSNVRSLPSNELQTLAAEYKPGSPSQLAILNNELPAAVRGEALNSFIDKQLTRYVKNEMATPGDPIRALAERGVLHFPARERVAGPIVTRDRLGAGFPEEGMALSQLAKNWEDISDKAIWSDNVGNIPYTDQLPDWIKKLKVEKPSAIHHTMNRGIANDDLGFSHLIDELSNALNPESGLPRHLLLDPKSMDRVSVPQAVERVAAINKWREAQKAEANAKLANNAATVLHKEYPDKGFKWVELKAKESPDMMSPTQMEDHAASISALKDALKYEGDTMGHCVGGYCDDVVSGRTKIYSLRDAKGEPHVTVEVAPGRKLTEADLPDNVRDQLADFDGSREEFEALVQKSLADRVIGDRIVQIKGKANRAPNEEYLPFVQDFVKSGKWSDVGDLQNSGLLKHSSGYLTKDELGKLVDEGDLDAIRLWQQSYINRITGERFAKGGLARIAARMGSDAAPARRGVSNVIKEKGGNWLTGSVEEALGGLKRPLGQAHDRAMFTEEMLADPRIAREVALRDRESALNSFIDKQLTRYVKNEMATPGDPIRALAERGVLHFEPAPEISGGTLSKAALNRGKTGNVSSGIGESQLAKQWETLSDAGLGVAPARQWRAEANKEILDKMPWLDKLDDEALIYEKQNPNLAGSLGFSHLIDELSNTLNPESGLPRHLLLDPKSMDRVSVPQAVERVAEINKWRAAQRAEADALRANNAATVLHKEYPDKGFKWVELRQPEETGRLVQGAERVDPRFEVPQEVQDRLQDQAYREALRRGIADDSDDMMEFVEGRTQELARQWDAKNPARIDEARKALQDALKYEGDTMGHCVGGYCDDVASGRSRIYSLRDAKGQPHVTIEVEPDAGDLYSLSGDIVDAFESSGSENFVNFLKENYPTEYKDFVTLRIAQIKGKANRAPNEEYLPFVQDFVKSGKWSDVGDLQNSGLVQHPSGYLTKDELGKLVDEGDLDAIRLWQQSYIDR